MHTNSSARPQSMVSPYICSLEALSSGVLGSATPLVKVKIEQRIRHFFGFIFSQFTSLKLGGFCHHKQSKHSKINIKKDIIIYNLAAISRRQWCGAGYSKLCYHSGKISIQEKGKLQKFTKLYKEWPWHLGHRGLYGTRYWKKGRREWDTTSLLSDSEPPLLGRECNREFHG